MIRQRWEFRFSGILITCPNHFHLRFSIIAVTLMRIDFLRVRVRVRVSARVGPNLQDKVFDCF
jgi:hypothetical protein